jgi:hypothetical protein
MKHTLMNKQLTEKTLQPNQLAVTLGTTDQRLYKTGGRSGKIALTLSLPKSQLCDS